MKAKGPAVHSPSLAEFKLSAKKYPAIPFVEERPFLGAPADVYRALAVAGRPSVLLESARPQGPTGRYSLVAGDPFLIFESKGRRVRLHARGASESFDADPLAELEKLLKLFSSPAHDAHAHFTGGGVGYFGYELKNLLEPHPGRRPKDDLGLPESYLLFFDEGVVFDHFRKSIFLFSNVRTGGDAEKRYKAGLLRLTALKKKVEACFGARAAGRGPASQAPRPLKIRMNLSRASFIQKAESIKRHIAAGDIFQANLSQRFEFPAAGSAFGMYERLRAMNPSPFFGFLDGLDFQIISGSPERLIKLERGVMETRPIAGTRPRGKSAEEDRALSRELMLSEKERAEHIMLVDLERNDMGRVAEYGSVRTNELMRIEDYSHVKHIVSNVRGALRPGLGPVDVLKAFFPGGTITGAPKVRCMEILDALEPTARGPYTGSLGYLGFNGSMDLNIIIRSLVVTRKKAYLQVGAGVVADSSPEREYDETLYKAEAVLKSLFGEGATERFFARCHRR